jgi:CheY-like chemotaxis protein
MSLKHDGLAARRPLHVLVIDDKPDNATSLALLLQINGYEVDTACDGSSAEAAVRSRSPDVLFIDLGMPGEDGYAVARRLRALFPVKPLLVALTGYGAEADQKRTIDEGFDHHLIKPADPDELLRLLDEYTRALAEREPSRA